MESKCINCNKKFKKKNQGYKRTAVFGKNSEKLCQTLEQEMDIRLTPASDRFLCAECTLLLRKISASDGVRHSFKTATADSSYVGQKIAGHSPNKKRRRLFSPRKELLSLTKATSPKRSWNDKYQSLKVVS